MLRSLSNAVIEGGMNSYLLSGLSFDSILDIPINYQFGKLILPIGITPFSQRERVPKHKAVIGFNKYDIYLATSLSTSYSYIDGLKKHIWLSPDYSIYRNAPLQHTLLIFIVIVQLMLFCNSI